MISKETNQFSKLASVINLQVMKGPLGPSIGTVILYSAEQSREHTAGGHAPCPFRPCITCPAFLATFLHNKYQNMRSNDAISITFNEPSVIMMILYLLMM